MNVVLGLQMQYLVQELSLKLSNVNDWEGRFLLRCFEILLFQVLDIKLLFSYLEVLTSCPASRQGRMSMLRNIVHRNQAARFSGHSVRAWPVRLHRSQFCWPRWPRAFCKYHVNTKTFHACDQSRFELIGTIDQTLRAGTAGYRHSPSVRRC